MKTCRPFNLAPKGKGQRFSKGPRSQDRPKAQNGAVQYSNQPERKPGQSSTWTKFAAVATALPKMQMPKEFQSELHSRTPRQPPDQGKHQHLAGLKMNFEQSCHSAQRIHCELRQGDYKHLDCRQRQRSACKAKRFVIAFPLWIPI